MKTFAFRVMLTTALLGAVTAWTQQPTRREWMTRLVVDTTTTTATAMTVVVGPAWAVTTRFDTTKAIGELQESMEKMKPIPE